MPSTQELDETSVEELDAQSVAPSVEEIDTQSVEEKDAQSVEELNVLGTMYPNHSSFSDIYLISRVTPEVPAGTQIGKHMCGTCLLLPTHPCLLVANRCLWD